MNDGILNWNLDPEIFTIMDTFPIRYYSILFIGGLFVAFQVEKSIFKKENIPVENLEKLFIYVIVGIVLGARCGTTCNTDDSRRQSVRSRGHRNIELPRCQHRQALVVA